MKLLPSLMLMLCFAAPAAAGNNPKRLKQLLFGDLAKAQRFKQTTFCRRPTLGQTFYAPSKHTILKIFVKGTRPQPYKLWRDPYNDADTFKPQMPRKKAYVRLEKYVNQTQKDGYLLQQEEVNLESNRKIYSRNKNTYRLDVAANAKPGSKIRFGTDALTVDRRDRRVPKGAFMIQELEGWSNGPHNRNIWKTSKTFLAPGFFE